MDLHRAPDKGVGEGIIRTILMYLFFLSTKTYVVNRHKNRLGEKVLMICCY